MRSNCIGLWKIVSCVSITWPFSRVNPSMASRVIQLWRSLKCVLKPCKQLGTGLVSSWHWWRTARKVCRMKTKKAHRFHCDVLIRIISVCTQWYLLYPDIPIPGFVFQKFQGVSCSSNSEFASVITSARTACKQAMKWCSELLMWSLEDLRRHPTRIHKNWKSTKSWFQRIHNSNEHMKILLLHIGHRSFCQLSDLQACW